MERAARTVVVTAKHIHRNMKSALSTKNVHGRLPLPMPG
jgi:hypothetical protein